MKLDNEGREDRGAYVMAMRSKLITRPNYAAPTPPSRVRAKSETLAQRNERRSAKAAQYLEEDDLD